jgi:hypothetical protein
MGDREFGRVFQWLVQVPVGVWPITQDNALFLIIFGILTFHFMVVLFQVIVHAGFKEFKGEQSPASLAFHVDVLYLCKRFIARRLRSKRPWPDRLILIYALESIRDRRLINDQGLVSFAELHNELCHMKSNCDNLSGEAMVADSITVASRTRIATFHKSELAALDPDALQQVWEWYYNQFGKTFLAPALVKSQSLNPEDATLEEIWAYVRRLQETKTSLAEKDEPSLPTLDEIKARTAQLNSLKHRLG